MTDKFISISDEEYFGDKTRLSASAVKTLVDSPRHFKYLYLEREDSTSKELEFGKNFHRFILEGYTPVLMPKFDKRTSMGKIQCEEFFARLGDKDIPLDEETYNDFFEMKASLKDYLPIFKDGIAEKVLYFNIQDIPFKMKFDCYSNLSLYDLKTTQSSERNSFNRDIIKYKYYIQAYLYLEAFKQNEIICDSFNFICIEKKAPYNSAIYSLNYDYLDIAKKQVDIAIKRYKTINTTGEYSSYENNSGILYPPAWLHKELETLASNSGFFTQYF